MHGTMEKKLVTVVVPVYNIEKYVGKCLKSLIDQKYRKIEIIVVNDGSTDDSLVVCETFLYDKRVTLLTKNNGGLSSARNYGMNYAHGEYIIFVDGDDFCHETYIQDLVNDIIKYNADISICNFYYTYKEKNIVNDSKVNKICLYNSNEAIKQIYKFGSFGVGVWNKLFRRSLFDDIEFPLGKISEDYYIMFKVFNRALIVVYDPKPLYYYVQRGGSITKSQKISFDVLEAAYRFKKFSLEQKDLELIEYANMNVIYSAIGIYNKGLVNKCMSKEEVKKLTAIINDNEYRFNKTLVGKPRYFEYFMIKKCRFIYDFLFIAFKKIRIKFRGR